MQENETVLDDLKDAIFDILAPEYHRLSTESVKYRLDNIEMFLAGAVGAFFVPYVKKLAEKAAEATWGAFASRRSAKAPDLVQTKLSNEELNWGMELIRKTSA